jgi:hypothetical protein
MNNLHLDFNRTDLWSAMIGDGGVSLGVKLQSSHPTVKCDGHWIARLGVVISVADGWADELCPDFDLSKLDLTIKLIPAVLNGMLTVGDVQVAVDLEPQGLPSNVIDFLVGATNLAEGQIAGQIRTKLMEDQTRKDLGELVVNALRSPFPELCRVVQAQVVGGNPNGTLVIRYEDGYKPGDPKSRTDCVATT